MTDEIVAGIRTQVPAYAGLNHVQLDEVSRIAAWAVSRVLSSWVDGTGLTTDDLRRLHGIGAARALDGRPLGNVLKAYRMAGRIVTDAVIERAGNELTAHDAMDLARTWMQSMDDISDALTLGHEATSAHIDSNHDEVLTTFVRDLLTGRNAGAATLSARAIRAGITVPTAMTLVAGPAHDVLLSAMGSLAATSSEHDPRALCHWVMHDGWAVALFPRTLEAATVTRMYSSPTPRWAYAQVSPHEVASVHALMRFALPSAPTHAWKDGRPMRLADAHAVALGSGSPLGSAHVLTTEVLAKLDDDPVLIETLSTHLGTGNANATSRLLGCHPQSIRHRIHRIVQLSGRDPRDPWDQYVLQSALLARASRTA